MATRKPLVLVSGQPAELPSGDDIGTPTAHATSHQSGGSDAIKLDDLAAPDDNTDLDATTLKHGLLPKLGGGTTNYLRADGSWAAPPGGGSSVFWSKISNSSTITITNTATATLNRLHLITTSSGLGYTVTISGLSPSTGDALGFIVSDYSTASGPVLLDAGGTVKIAGRTRYLYLVHTNVALLMWDGSNWIPLVLCLDTPWTIWAQGSGCLNLQGSTTDPTDGSIDTAFSYWRRIGNDMHWRAVHIQTSGGTAGTGTYYFGLPWNVTIDSAWTYATTSPVADSPTDHVGMGAMEASVLTFMPYDSTSLYALRLNESISNIVNATNSPWNGAHNFALNVQVPILYW